MEAVLVAISDPVMGSDVLTTTMVILGHASL
jgi:hypothetical protein